jgi:hypothetical protein
MRKAAFSTLGRDFRSTVARAQRCPARIESQEQHRAVAGSNCGTTRPDVTRALLPLFLLLAACGDGSRGGANAAGPDAPASEAELAQDAELANEAAADEAADIENFGGNAAALDDNRQ